MLNFQEIFSGQWDEMCEIAEDVCLDCYNYAQWRDKLGERLYHQYNNLLDIDNADKLAQELMDYVESDKRYPELNYD